MSHLILTRRIGEKLLIGDDIEVSVSNIHGRQVRISIKAPKNIKILRQELCLNDSNDWNIQKEVSEKKSFNSENNREVK